MKNVSSRLTVRHVRRRGIASRFLNAAAAGLLLLAPLQARRGPEATDSPSGTQDSPSYSVQVDMVGVQATVQDRSGKVVPDLGKDDFTIYDNGEPQVITQFSREDTPLSVSILLDASGSMAGGKIADARRSLRHFLKRLRPDDEVMLMSFRTSPEVVQDFTSHFEKMGRAMEYMEGGGFTALYDAILAALEHSRAAQHSRRALLLISDGINTRSRAELQDAVDQLRREAVELFAIALDNTPCFSAEKMVSRFTLQKLTGSAGGGVFIVNDPGRLDAVCRDIAERMHKQYTFAYYPPRAAKGGWRSIEIRSRIPGLKVLASKTGYYPASTPGAASLQ